MTKSSKADQDANAASWDRYRPKPELCPICKTRDSKVGAKTCREPECAREYDRRYARGFYKTNSAKIIAQTSASRRRRHNPIIKHCVAPHPTIPGAICGKEFEVKTTGDGRRLTCSLECSRRRRWAKQRDRYHANPQAKRDYKNAHYAENYAKPLGKTRCPNPGCRREYVKQRRNQHTCGRPSCHVWKYQTANRKKVNRKKREKRCGNPAYAAYQRNYRKANPEKFKAYRPRINERQRQRRAAARQAAIAAGTFVDRRRKLTESQRAKIIKRSGAGESLKRIAKSYNVHVATIVRICNTSCERIAIPERHPTQVAHHLLIGAGQRYERRPRDTAAAK
jgi:CENP-B N-terminal DNA-binding domain